MSPENSCSSCALEESSDIWSMIRSIERAYPKTAKIFEGNIQKVPRLDDCCYDIEKSQVDCDDVGQLKIEARCQISHL